MGDLPATVLKSSERIGLGLATLEAIALAGESTAVKRAAARDLLEYEGKLGPGTGRMKKSEHVVGVEVLGVFRAVLAEVVEVDRSCVLERSSLESPEGDSEE